MSEPENRVDIVSPDGKLGSVPQSGLEAAIAQGFTLPSKEQGTELEKRKQYGTGLGTELKAGAEGAARGLTFGASDWALSKSGLVDQEALAERKARNPYSAGAGEAAGVIGGLALPTGWLGAGVKGAAAAGELGTRGAAALLARAGVEGGTLASRALASGVKAATGSAVEGALYGAGQGISEAALGDPADAAEKILGHATMGALLGGTLGGAAGALGGVGSKALQKFARPAGEAAVDAAPSVARQAIETEGAAKPASLISDFLNDLAGEQALRAAGLPKATFKKLQRNVKAVPGVDTAVEDEAAQQVQLHTEAARIMRENRLAQAGDTFEDVGNRVQAHIGKAKQTASDIVAKIDATAEGAPLVDLRSYADDLDSLAKKFEVSPETRAEYAQLKQRANDYRKLADDNAGTVRLTDKQIAERDRIEAKITRLSESPSADPSGAQEVIGRLQRKLARLPVETAGEGSGGVSLAEAEDLKRGFDAAFSGLGTSASKQIARESRGIFNARIEQAAKAAADPADFAKWKAAKREMEALIPVLEGNKNKLQTLTANRTLSLTDQLAGLTGLGSIGVNPLGFAGGLAMAGANKLMREYGSAAISDTASRLAQGLGASRGAQALQLMHIERTKNFMSQRLQGAADGIVRALGQVPKAVTPLTVDAADKLTMLPEQKMDGDKQVTHALHDRVTELTNLAGNPEMLQQRLDESMGDLPKFAPRLAAQMHFTAVQAVGYLADKVPKNPYPDAPLNVRQAWRPSATETVAFERTLRAVHDPMGTIEEFQAGHVTREAADALRAVYPTMYGKLVEQIVPAVVNAPKVPLQRRLQLADMLGVEMDVFTSAGFAANMQQMYADSAKQAAPPARPAVSKNYRAKQSETPLQRALSEG